MTSSNVSNLLVQVKSINVEMPAGKVDKANNSTLFESTLKNIAGSNVQGTDLSKVVEPKATPADNTASDASKKLSGTKNSKLEDSAPVKEKEPQETVDKVVEAVDEIKEVIADELSVSEEDIEKAIEELGLTLMDLFNPQKLADVVAALKGEEDSITLVMSDEFKAILDSVNEITDQLLQETKIPLEDFKEIIASFETKGEKEIAPLVQENLTQENKEVPVETTEELQPMKNEENKAQVSSNDVVKENVNKESKDVIATDDNYSDVEASLEKQNATENKKESFNEGQSSDAKAFKMEIKPETKLEIKGEGIVYAEPKFELQFSSEEQIVTLPTGETVRSEEIINQLVEQARVLTNAESTTMEMTLNPEGLGKIYLEVTQKGNDIVAKIFTENDAVKQALESQMANLKLEMNQSSTKVTSIEVSVGTHEFERNLEEDARNQQQRNEQEDRSRKQTRGINLNSLDELSGLMSDEDALIAQMMIDNGNTLDYQA